MTDILLQTKLYIPVTRGALVPRPALLTRLLNGLTGRLTLISAPAGFGKTTLAADFGRAAAERGWQTAWLSLDDHDNDVGRFFRYLLAALQTVDPQAGPATQALLSGGQANLSPALTASLINDIAGSRASILLVLDDYHLIDNPALHEAVFFLIENSPPHFHLLLLTRADPPFSLTRLRARHQLQEVRQADLRFTEAEAAEFLNQLMSLSLSPAAIHALEQRTEGWVAGLQMAALSLQNSADPETFIAAFTGSHRYIFDYLAEEALARHPAGTRAFLLQTAVLERLSAPLCNALLDRSDGQAILETLERANLFLVPLDDVRGWYRYHHLFGDLLRQFLRREMPEREAPLHRRASRWFADAGYPYEAIDHALLAGDSERAAALLEPIAHGMGYRMENERLGRWVSALPDDLLLRYPGIVFPYAITLSATMQMDAYTAFLEKMAGAAQAHLEEPAAQLILGQIGVLKCIRLHIFGEYEAALPAVAAAESQLRRLGQPAERWELISIHGYARHHLDGAGPAALALLERASLLSQQDEGSIGTTLCQTFLANCLISQGQLHAAAACLRHAAAAATLDGKPQIHAVFPAALAARLHYEWNDLDAAAAQVDGYLPYPVVAGFTLDPLDTVFVHTFLPLARGDAAAAQANLTTARAYFETQPLAAGFQTRLAAIQALLWLRTGRLTAAQAWAETLSLPAAGDSWRALDVFGYLVWARIKLAANQAAAAAPLLARLQTWAAQQGCHDVVLETALLQALAAAAKEAALAHLETALALAAPQGYVRRFVDEGEPLRPLLAAAARQGETHDYAAALLAHFPAPMAAPAAQAVLLDPLSPRELEVLTLLAQGLTNKEIAERLFIAVSTAKRHAINIYNKLGVSNRTEAAARAYELDLIPRP